MKPINEIAALKNGPTVTFRDGERPTVAVGDIICLTEAPNSDQQDARTHMVMHLESDPDGALVLVLGSSLYAGDVSEPRWVWVEDPAEVAELVTIRLNEIEAYRSAYIAALGTRPGWWRPFRRRRYDRELARRRTADITYGEVVLNSAYDDHYAPKLLKAAD